MATELPLIGQCNARLSNDKGYCSARDLVACVTSDDGEKRCISHCGGPRKVVLNGEEAYLKMLTEGMAPAKKRLFRMIPRGTNLEFEIGLIRTQIGELRSALNRGETGMAIGLERDDEDGTLKCKQLAIPDLLDRSVSLLNQLVRTQAVFNPQRRMSGGLTLTVELPPTAGPENDDVNDDLEADSMKELPPGQQTVDMPVVTVHGDDKFGELDDA